MPAVVSRHVALRADLRVTVTRVLDLNDRLEAVVAVKSRQPSSVFHGKVDFSQPPWNTSAANVILDLHAFARSAEARLREAQGLPARKRGGSSENTGNALREIAARCENADDDTVVGVVRELDRLCRRALIVLGAKETVRRLPRVHGQPGARCPWCRRDTLRQKAVEGVVFCIDPECRDAEKRRPVARLEYFGGEMVLRWQDGIIGATA